MMKMIKFLRSLFETRISQEDLERFNKNCDYVNRIMIEGSDFHKADRVFSLLIRKINLYRNKGNIDCIYIPLWMTNYNSNRLKPNFTLNAWFLGVRVLWTHNKLIKVVYGDEDD